MIITIGSLVQETSHRIRSYLTISLYVFACLVTSSVVGVLLSGIGQAFHSINCQFAFCSSISPLAIWGIGGIAVAYAASDIGLLSLPRPRLMDAVPLIWWRWWKPYGAALAYGAALGLGITTRIQFGTFYILCLWCIYKGDLVYGTMLMGTYGGVRAFTLLPVSWGIYCYRGQNDSNRRIGNLLRWLSNAKLITALVLVIFGTLLLTSLIF